MRSIEGEGDRVGTQFSEAACLPITLTLVRVAPSTPGSSARGQALSRSHGRGYLLRNAASCGAQNFAIPGVP
jgi:hypothetical protein